MLRTLCCQAQEFLLKPGTTHEGKIPLRANKDFLPSVGDEFGSNTHEDHPGLRYLMHKTTHYRVIILLLIWHLNLGSHHIL